MIIVYGLKNCDTCRKALKWLAAEGMEHTFHDLRKVGVEAATVADWSKAVGWEVLLNKRGTTWRGLEDAVKNETNESNVSALMAQHPALIKRPVFDAGGRIIVGFKDEQRQELVRA
ncbi:MAG: arsenate reductase [Alphaproteobacteria bacterium]|nr:arsenate reductase [Alphaproteobacteria bacterium]